MSSSTVSILVFKIIIIKSASFNINLKMTYSSSVTHYVGTLLTMWADYSLCGHTTNYVSILLTMWAHYSI